MSTPLIKRVSISNIRLDFQLPEVLDREKVIEYVNKIKHRETLPLIQVRFDGENYFLQDGFHRVEAAKRCGLKTLKAEVTKGTIKDMEEEFQTSLKTALVELRKEQEIRK